MPIVEVCYAPDKESCLFVRCQLSSEQPLFLILKLLASWGTRQASFRRNALSYLKALRDLASLCSAAAWLIMFFHPNLRSSVLKPGISLFSLPFHFSQLFVDQVFYLMFAHVQAKTVHTSLFCLPLSCRWSEWGSRPVQAPFSKSDAQCLALVLGQQSICGLDRMDCW